MVVITKYCPKIMSHLCLLKSKKQNRKKHKTFTQVLFRPIFKQKDTLIDILNHISID